MQCLNMLPSDNIRAIIRASRFDDLEKLKSISPRWNTLVMERFAYRKGLPSIDLLKCRYWNLESSYWTLRSVHNAEIKMTCKGKYFPFFGIDLGNRGNIEPDQSLSNNQLSGLSYEDSGACPKLTAEGRNMKKRVWKCSRVEILSVDQDTLESSFLSDFRHILGNVPVGTLALQCDSFRHFGYCNAVSNLIDAHAVKYLSLCLNNGNDDTLFEFITEILGKKVKMIDIVDNKKRGYHDVPNYLLNYLKKLGNEGKYICKIHSEYCGNSPDVIHRLNITAN